jgi:aconitate decarboxylase
MAEESKIDLMTGMTEKLCRKIAAMDYQSLDEDVKQRARQLFLDGIAVAVAGSYQEEPPKILAENFKEMGGYEQASVIGLGFKTSLVQAAVINGASMHVLDFEPMWNPPNHQLSTCLPAILALAEYRKLEGKDVLAALVLGVEMMGRLRQASGQFDLQKVPFHPPGMVGPMGAAVAASHILKLDAEALRNALGIVSSRCGSLMANTGTYTKCIHCGYASASGLESALLAEKGFTGNTNVLENEKGYVNAFFDRGTFDVQTLLDYGSPWRICSPGYEIKRYPSNFGTHAAINAALQIRDQLGEAGNIEKVTITGPNLSYLDRPFPKTGLDGKFSMQYTAACALLDGEITLSTFSDSRRFSPDVEELLKKTENNLDPGMPAELNRAHLTMEVRLSDGRVLKSSYPPADFKFGKTLLPFEEHAVKVRSCLGTRMNEAKTSSVINLCRHIDELGPKEFMELMNLVRC